MSFIKKVGVWLLYSSNNSAKVSLTVKSVLTGLVTVGTVYAGLANIQLPTEQATEAIEGIVSFVQTALLAISSATAAYGLVRKLWTTITGSNHVVNSKI